MGKLYRLLPPYLTLFYELTLAIKLNHFPIQYESNTTISIDDGLPLTANLAKPRCPTILAFNELAKFIINLLQTLPLNSSQHRRCNSLPTSYLCDEICQLVDSTKHAPRRTYVRPNFCGW